MWRLHYTHWIDFVFENLHQATKNWLWKIVNTFLVLFSDGNHKLTTWMESLILSYCACKISTMRMYEFVSKVI